MTREEREEAIKVIQNFPVESTEERKAVLMVIKALEQEPCGDAIDRAEAIKIASGYCHPANVAKELAKLPAVNPMPCEDAISRQAALRQAINAYKMAQENGFNFKDICEEYLNVLPPATPQPKIGHWINIGSEGEIDGQIVQSFSCSECGAISIFRIGYKRPINSDLCPNCGCRMVEPQEREE